MAQIGACGEYIISVSVLFLYFMYLYRVRLPNGLAWWVAKVAFKGYFIEIAGNSRKNALDRAFHHIFYGNN